MQSAYLHRKNNMYHLLQFKDQSLSLLTMINRYKRQRARLINEALEPEAFRSSPFLRRPVWGRKMLLFLGRAHSRWGGRHKLHLYSLSQGQINKSDTEEQRRERTLTLFCNNFSKGAGNTQVYSCVCVRVCIPQRCQGPTADTRKASESVILMSFSAGGRGLSGSCTPANVVN